MRLARTTRLASCRCAGLTPDRPRTGARAVTLVARGRATRFQTAAEAGVTVFSHIRYAGVLEPETSIAAVQEMIADAAGSGASVHIVHIGSSGLAQMPTVIEMTSFWTEAGV